VTAFLDASALVKLYAEERGAEVVRVVTEPYVVSGLSRVEVLSAMWRKSRDQSLGSEELLLLTAAFDADWRGSGPLAARFVVVPVLASVLESAGQGLARWDLHSGDALQLASAMAARSADPGVDTLVTFDRQLAAAASAEGFAVLGDR
jgi:uncharacterized protein